MSGDTPLEGCRYKRLVCAGPERCLRMCPRGAFEDRSHLGSPRKEKCEHYTDDHEGPCPICDEGTIKRVGRFICLDELGLVEALRVLPMPDAIRLKKHIEELADQGRRT